MSTISEFLEGISLIRVFVVTFIVGCTAIFFGGLLKNDILTFCVPLLAMVVYCWAGLKKTPPLATSISFAESIYFLGFLFTLVAMTASLLFFSEHDVRGIIVRFSLALVTTIFGLLVRVILVNFQISLEDSKARAEYDLMEAGTRLRKQLEQISVSMISQTRLMNETLQYASQKVTEELVGSVEKSRDTLEKATSQLTGTMESVSASVEKNVEAVSKGQSEFIERSTKAASERVESLIDDIKTMSTENASSLSDSVKQNTEAFSKSVASLIDDIKKTSVIATTSMEESMRQSANALNGGVDGFLVKIKTVSDELEEALKTPSLPREMFVSELKPPLDSLKNYLVQHSEDLAQLADKQLSVEKETVSLADAISELTSLTEKLCQSTEKVQDALGGVSAVNSEAERLTRALAEASQGLSQYGNSLEEQGVEIKQFRDQVKTNMEDYKREIEADLEFIRTYKSELNNQVTVAAESLQMMHRQMTDAAKHILAELKG